MCSSDLNIARDTGVKVKTPTTRDGWGRLARRLGIKVIHIAERDTQVSPRPKEVGEFVNTWSIDGFVSEGGQPAEMGWGTHEKALPPDGRRHTFGCDAAIYLNRPGLLTRVRTWTPLEGPFHGFIITHNESISMADYFTVRDGKKVVYRPTVHYAYHPCDQAIMSMHEIAGKNLKQQKRQRLIVEEITSGRDELGVLLMGHKKGAYWYGSQLTIDEARKLRIPIVGILDTNCDPDEVDFPIPGNDDAIRSVALLTRVIADAVAEGLMARAGVAAGNPRLREGDGSARALGSLADPDDRLRRQLSGRPALLQIGRAHV